MRDSDSGLEQMSIGHHIRDRAHILQRSRNHRTGDQEERQDYINLDAFRMDWLDSLAVQETLKSLLQYHN